MWIILFNALDDFGVKEINNRSIEPSNTRIEEVKRKILEEALHGALRIAGLVRQILVQVYLTLTPDWGPRLLYSRLMAIWFEFSIATHQFIY